MPCGGTRPPAAGAGMTRLARQRAAGPVQQPESPWSEVRGSRDPTRAQAAAASPVAPASPLARVLASRRRLQAASRACPPPSGPDGRGAGAIRPGRGLSVCPDASQGEPRPHHQPAAVPPPSTDRAAARFGVRCAGSRGGRAHPRRRPSNDQSDPRDPRASRAARDHPRRSGYGRDPPSLQAKQRSAPEATGPQPAVTAHAEQGDRHAAALQGPEEGGHGRQAKPPPARRPADRRHSSGRRGSVHSRGGRRCPPGGAGRGP